MQHVEAKFGSERAEQEGTSFSPRARDPSAALLLEMLAFYSS
jgi:hypothetical protein